MQGGGQVLVNKKHRGLNVFKKFMVVILLVLSATACQQDEEETAYYIYQLKDAAEKEANDYTVLNRGAKIILEVVVEDNLSVLNSEVFFDEDKKVTDFYSFRWVVINKVLQGDKELEGEYIYIKETVAIHDTNGYEYYEGQLDSCLKAGQTYLVYLEEADTRGMYPITNEGLAKRVLNESALNEEWMVLTFLNHYGKMTPRKYVLEIEEEYRAEEHDILYITFGGRAHRVEYYYDSYSGRTFMNINNKYYSIGGRISFQ